MSSRPAVILVVDDDALQQELTVTALHHIGVMQPVHCVSSGSSAIAYVRGDGQYVDRVTFPYPELIITDLQMCDGDGYTLLLHLKSHSDGPHCPVLILSSMDDEAHITQARELGAAAYIVKPMTFDGTREGLRAFCSQFLNLQE